MANKVQFNLKNVHYAVLTESESDGNISESYGDVKAVRGAVSVSLTQDGEMSPFYADGVKYFIANSNQGYSGTLEMAKIPVTMLEDVWGMENDDNGVLVENAEDEIREFALMFEIDGDEDAELYCFYKCSAARPNIDSKTNEESKEPSTQSLDLTISPLLSNGNIKAHTTDDTTTLVRKSWFNKVYGFDGGVEQ